MKHKSNLRILYLSNVLTVPDHLFLSTLTQAGYDTYLVTFKEKLPELIQDIPGLNIIHKPLICQLSPVNTNLNNNIEREDKNWLKRCFRNLFDGINKIVRKLQIAFEINIFGSMAIFLSPLRAYHLTKVIRDIHPHILHAVWVPDCGLIGALSRFHPLLLMPMASDILFFPKRFMNRWITKFIIKKAEMITCDCEIVKNKVIKLTNYPEDDIVVFPRGIDLNLFYPDYELRRQTREILGLGDKKVIIMTRNFESIYGIEYFIKSLPSIIRKIPDTTILFIGSGSLRGKFEKLIYEEGIDDNVQFLGLILNSEIPRYLNASDIYVSSSLSDGSSVSLLEAMGCSLPVVVTDVPSNFEWVQDRINGFIVPKKDPESLAEKIIFLLQNEEKAKEMGRRNLEIARERADWNKNFKKLEDIYDRLSDAL